jgi:hypothetical protein
MFIQNTVVDANSGAPLAGATIALDGSPIGVTDSNGRFAIDTAASGTTVTVSYVGYTSESYPVDIMPDLAQIQLSVSSVASALPAVTVTPSGNFVSPAAVTNKPAAWLPLVLAGGALFVFSGGGKKKKVAGVDTNTILLVGSAAVAMYFFTRPSSVPAYAAPVPAYNPAYLQSISNQGNQTAQDISAGGQAASNILTAISNF